MANSILKDGPLDGQPETIPVSDRFYSTRVAGRRAVYDNTEKKDPATGLTIVAFRAEPSGVHQG